MRRPEKIEDITPYELLLSILASFDHGQMAGKNLNRLSFLTGNLPESKERLREIKPNLTTAIKTYLSFTQNQLSEISQYAGRFKDLAPAVIELDQKTAELNEVIGGISLDKLDVEAAKGLTDKVPNIITEVRKIIKIVKKKIQNRFAADLPEVVISVFNAMSMIMKEQGATLNIIIDKAHSTRPVFFVRRELVTILEELISNAMTSMESAESKIVTLGIYFNEDEVFIKISDTGHGVNEQDSDRLFSRDFSTKKDGGFGLYYVQQQCEKFGADVSIYNNDDSPGTTVKLILRAVDDSK
jgi:signal transduction histidine kinase